MDWIVQVGNWFANKNSYPRGMKPVGDALKAAGLGFILWFEPERAYKDTYLTKEHPEWLLGPLNDNYLFNLGDPEAHRYMTDLISSLIAEGGVTWYRQDFNFHPALYWQAADAPNRVGMSEIRHIEGLYAFWDALLARHPGLMIDNCAGGGRRIDLETISRSVPLWRTDFQVTRGDNNLANQTETHGLSFWVPLFGTHCNEPDPYVVRSCLGPGMVVPWSTIELEMQAGFSMPMARRLLQEELAVRPYFYGDFYPLVSFSSAEDNWTAWQFDRPDLGEGMVLALRRPQSPFPRLETPLHGLEPDARYEWHSMDSGAVTRVSGRELLETGVSIEIESKPGSALYVYRRLS